MKMKVANSNRKVCTGCGGLKVLVLLPPISSADVAAAAVSAAVSRYYRGYHTVELRLPPKILLLLPLIFTGTCHEHSVERRVAPSEKQY